MQHSAIELVHLQTARLLVALAGANPVMMGAEMHVSRVTKGGDDI